jgi:GTP 3',8-cyclase
MKPVFPISLTSIPEPGEIVLNDLFGRVIDYLRISVTDRCNLRCAYCMPPEGVAWKPHSEILTYEEITAVVRAAAELGVHKVRLTGGEPLVRAGLSNLVSELAAIPGINDISLTSNGLLLEKQAQELTDAGLTRVNISLDTLDPAKFRRLTRFGDLGRAWAGIEAAERAGLAPIKINSVVVRGVNDDELESLSRLTVEHPWHVRFIELMPVGNDGDWGSGLPPAVERYLSVHEMQARLAPLGLEPCEGPTGNGPARVFHLPRAAGTVGFISPLGQHFCDRCNRLRLTADGRLRPCLLSEQELDVRSLLRSGKDVRPVLRQAVLLKPEGHTLTLPGHTAPQDRMMCQIGG